MEKVGSKAERDVRVMERWAYGRAGRHKDRPQSSEESDFISFIANEASRYIPGSVPGSSGRSCAVPLFAPSTSSCHVEAMHCDVVLGRQIL